MGLFIGLSTLFSVLYRGCGIVHRFKHTIVLFILRLGLFIGLSTLLFVLYLGDGRGHRVKYAIVLILLRRWDGSSG